MIARPGGPRPAEPHESLRCISEPGVVRGVHGRLRQGWMVG